MRIPPAHAEDATDEKLYTVHRSLLKTHTNLLAPGKTKPRDTAITLPPSTPTAAFESVLEYIYTGGYALADEYEPAPERDAGPSPLLRAAMEGPIGVWGKPAAVHDGSRRNISSYESVYTGARNEYLEEKPPPPPPPPSPTAGKFADREPELAKEVSLVLKSSTPASRLASHLEVYALARVYGVRKLSEISLDNIKPEVVASPEILHELVRVVYGTKQRNEDLRAFVVGIVKDHWELLRSEKVFEAILKEGGEFVLDLFSQVRGF